jgi:hypothetical protein
MRNLGHDDAAHLRKKHKDIGAAPRGRIRARVDAAGVSGAGAP